MLLLITRQICSITGVQPSSWVTELCGPGCWLQGGWCVYGAIGFCDNLLLLAPIRDGIQLMLDICQRFVAKYSLQFSTDPNPVKSKTKCIFGYGPARSMQKPVNLCSDGKQLPLVESALHLGHLPSYRNDLNDKWTIPGSSWFPLFPYLNNISRIAVANLFPILVKFIAMFSWPFKTRH